VTQPNPAPSNPQKYRRPIPPPKKGKWRRRLIKLFIVLIILAIAFVALTPSILSTSFAREAFVQWANGKLGQGSLQIRDWSFGWDDPTTIEGLSLLDAQGSHLLDVGQIKTDITLWNFLRGNYDLGATRLSALDFDARLDRDKNLNLLAIFKSPHIPPLTGMLQIARATGTFNDANFHDSWILDSIDATLSFSKDGQAIKDGVVMQARLSNQPFGQITVKGNLDLTRQLWRQSIAINDADAAPITPLISQHNRGLQIAGLLGATVEIQSDKPQTYYAHASLHLKPLTLTGPTLNGDTIKYPQLQALLNADASDGNLTIAAAATAQSDHVTAQATIPAAARSAAPAALQSAIGAALRGDQSITIPMESTPPLTPAPTLHADITAPALLSQLPNTRRARSTPATQPSN
jgi:hypothetical protein